MKLRSALVLLAALLTFPAMAQDGDGDGVLDTADECPASPAGVKVLSDGCTPRNDCRKPRADEPVDEKGCAIERVYILKGVTFEFDSDRLTQQGKTSLQVIADALKAYPEIRFELSGHTCSMGSDEYNLQLSDRRARSAGKYLVELGVNAGRMTAKGFGETQPVDTNDNVAGREYNRRVELKVLE